MNTFVEAKTLEDNPHFFTQSRYALGQLNIETIDEPIVDIIKNIATIPYVFTLQSCYGHFLYNKLKAPQSIETISIDAKDQIIKYRIAYIALCVENSINGRNLLEEICLLPLINPDNIQFGSAGWFWQRQINSYVIQVESLKFQLQDQCRIHYEVALMLEKIRNKLFHELRKIIERHLR